MPQHQEHWQLPEPPDIALQVCQQAVVGLCWRVLSQNANGLLIKEVAASSTSSTWPCEIAIRLAAIPQGTQLQISGSNFGFGPIQSSHVQGQVGNVVNRIQVCYQQFKQQQAHSTAPSPVMSLVAELEKLGHLRAQGILTEDEFIRAKNRMIDNE